MIEENLHSRELLFLLFFFSLEVGSLPQGFHWQMDNIVSETVTTSTAYPGFLCILTYGRAF